MPTYFKLICGWSYKVFFLKFSVYKSPFGIKTAFPKAYTILTAIANNCITHSV